MDAEESCNLTAGSPITSLLACRYCEQYDLHSPQSTVGEALWFSARLRLAPEVSNATMYSFMQEVRVNAAS